MLDADEFWSVANLGFTLLESGRYAEARAVFEGLTVTHPREFYPWEALGEIAVLEEQVERAVELLQHAVNLGAGARACIRCGEQLMSLGRWSEAHSLLGAPARGEGAFAKRARALQEQCRSLERRGGSAK